MDIKDVFVAMKDVLISLFLTKEVLLILIFLLFVKLFIFTLKIAKKRKIRNKIKSLTDEQEAITPEDYFKLRNKKIEGERTRYSNNFNFKGVYVLHNVSKDLYYVGQSIKVLDRVGNHFLGRGNGDVYADYKYGDKFSIRVIPLDNSGFNTLNELELYAIEHFKAYSKGYNRNKGNKTKGQG